ncbi:hypothetical protein [Couchioplanes caeruleus]|uniref:DUF8175 domain-containing protein n=2 Tax=Couchioplanes caeruleus TaxID=56438 RepID=A0A1K0FNT1_9ACTN|nr:hypothetical protein [Couchioplanes caeruleus]OJF14495.1 hypothetical protein BG844_09120 [Couchioplanes caeruleus subsp. caeruleus]ROP21246.1 hypothetical protein EDD30_7642 [Couchioplanes caeruleus]
MSDETDFADPSPWTRPRFVLAAVFLALVVLLGIGVAVWSSGDEPDSGPAGAPAAPGQAPAAAPTASSVLPTAVPTRAPEDVTWQLAGQHSVPVSASAGPRTVAGGVASGYARTPEGALIAAAQLAARAAFSAGRGSWEPTVQRQFVAGADRDKLLATLRAVPDQPAEPGELSPLAGYIYQSYTPDTAVIGLVYRAPGTGASRYHVVTTTLQWRGDDWQMVAPPGGSWLSVSRPAPDLTGVVEWGSR